ncbi:MAG: quinol:cytochrome C oxidoreductase, partial [Chitinophagales bacterium]|nr:quinol:cytochrome C oxidoreductase [Chitinophagales bacterium]
AHWYSTMYGWYSFASFWVTGLAVITLVVLYLKSKNYLSVVTDSHLHDLGRAMFAFSIFWTYLTFVNLC